MSSLTCRIGAGQPVSIPGWLDAAFVDAIADEFQVASGGTLKLEIDITQLRSPILDRTGKLGSFDLHRALRALVGSPAKPVDTIGILLASRYRYDSRVFGIMFDTAFDLDVHTEGTARNTAGPPREGAAVFLDEISDNRHTGVEQLRQTFFSTVHELGHVFNLAHSSECCFMRTSLADTSYEPADCWRFTATQSSVLSRADPSEIGIWPGESSFREFENEDREQFAAGTRRRPIVLSVGMAREHFHHFEPVELDVEVSLASGRTKSVSILDVIDPGYENFQIWLEEPNGERRRFRSPRVYCSAGATRKIAKGTPFRRDISIFGEAGGYTFRRPGVHRLWIELFLPNCAPCISNILEFDIQAIKTEKVARTAKIFSTPAIRTVLYHRIDRHRGRGMSALREWLRSQRSDKAAPTVRYALARALLEKTTGARRAPPPELLKAIRRLLHLAADDKNIGGNQRTTATRMLDADDLIA